MRKFIDLAGKKFGRLTVKEATNKRKNRSVVWLCVCECGNIYLGNSNDLQKGHTKSCGCLKIAKATTHGKRYSSVYKSWAGMLQRCENKNNVAYQRYGGRGIAVCERWHVFEEFYKDMGDCPKGLSLERIENSKGYFPKNCCWATPKEQANNTRNLNWFFAYNESTGEWEECDSQAEFARKHKLSRSAISMCLNENYKQHKGWTFRRMDGCAS